MHTYICLGTDILVLSILHCFITASPQHTHLMAGNLELISYKLLSAQMEVSKFEQGTSCPLYGESLNPHGWLSEL